MTVDCLRLGPVVVILGTSKVRLRLLGCMSIEWTVALDFLQELLRSHVFISETDMFEILLLFWYDTAFLAILTPQLQTSITCQCHY